MPAGLIPYNDATRAVVETLSGVRTPERALVEFFGIAPSDRVCPRALREKRVRWTPALAKLGFDEMTFLAAARSLCPDVPMETFEAEPAPAKPPKRRHTDSTAETNS